MNYSSSTETPEGNLTLCESPVKAADFCCESDLPQRILTPERVSVLRCADLALPTYGERLKCDPWLSLTQRQ